MNDKFIANRKEFEDTITTLVEGFLKGELHACAVTFMDDEGTVTSMRGGCPDCLQMIMEELIDEDPQDIADLSPERTLQ